MENENSNVKPINLDKLDAAIKAAEARKAAKAALGNTGTATSPVKAAKPAKEKKVKDTSAKDAEKAAKDAEKAEKDAAKALAKAAKEAERIAKKQQLEAERAERKAKKTEEKAAKIAAKGSTKKPAHMVKLEKAASKLPALTEAAEKEFNFAVANLTAADVAALALHLQHHNRVAATERALNSKIEQGMRVRIVGGDPRHIGKEGTVEKAQRIRAYIVVDGLDKEIYCFTSDVEQIADEAPAVAEA
jgi:flagellar biosynthesis GTPase FlhF